MCANNPTFNLKVVSKGKGGSSLIFQRLHEEPPPGQSSWIELGSNMKLWFYLHDNLWWSSHQCNLSSQFTLFPIHVTFKHCKELTILFVYHRRKDLFMLISGHKIRSKSSAVSSQLHWDDRWGRCSTRPMLNSTPLTISQLERWICKSKYQQQLDLLFHFNYPLQLYTIKCNHISPGITHFNYPL